MAKFIAVAKNFVKGEAGATMVEYGIMVALIAIVCLAAVGTLGTDIRDMFTNLGSSLPSGSAP